ncbi:nucleotide sugar dehydrogenase [Methylobacterium sp. WL6]|uniref:nucleotide sugar dehydrogenase n=1 Tax=Methylobacterium sp. WL6 TaxID=2603901 RepID=UPI0011CA396B|nr:nucleotide sugar dehydrogenase [Methylobacterium sp. WL6]TXN71083.1 nucleotide sugar dehydrogenase [Methylobacterium sp. WL6]
MTEDPAAVPHVSIDAIAARFERCAATIGVVGLGYVGLPLCLAATEAGFAVVGFDIDADKPAMLMRGETYLEHIPARAVAAMAGSGRFRATTDFDNLAQVDAILICVPTPLTRQREPDLSFVRTTTQEIAKRLRPGQLVVLESTTWPGTTDQVVRPLLEALTGYRSGSDFFLAFSPEREDPGNRAFSTATIPKIVGGDGPAAARLAEALYAPFVARTVMVSSTATAEATKLTENIFRAVNIALVNELKVIFDAMGIDVWEVIEAAKTKPFGFTPFYPGPGLGGHCIPIDPFYLTWKAREFGIATKFIELAGEINQQMPGFVLDKLIRALDTHAGRGLSGSRILIVGLAYKKNISDIRESPALRLWSMLEARGARVAYHDPFVPAVPATREYRTLQGARSVALTDGTLASFDAVLIVTDHDAVDYPAICGSAWIVVDCRNALRSRGLTAKIVISA